MITFNNYCVNNVIYITYHNSQHSTLNIQLSIILLSIILH